MDNFGCKKLDFIYIFCLNKKYDEGNT